MPLGKVTFFFRDSKFGWSETYYALGTTTNPISMNTAAGKLAALRADLLAPGVLLERVRLSLESDVAGQPAPRQFVTLDPPIPSFRGGVPYYNTGFVKPDGSWAVDPQPSRPYSILLIEGDTADGRYHKRLYLSGWLREDIDDPVDLNFSALFTIGLSLFKAQFIAATFGVWGFKVMSRDPVTAPPHAITNVVVAGGVATVTSVDAAPAANTRVRVTGVKGTGNRIDGVWTAVNPVGNSFALKEFKGAFAYGSGGAWRAQVPVVVQPSDLEAVSETHRKRGKGFGVSVGKLKAGSLAH